MALLRRTETRVMFLAAIVVMATMVFTALPCAQAKKGVCEHLPGCTIKSCRAKCKSKGYANTVVDCGKTGKGTSPDNCCCYNTSATELA
ncbi:hypothetical protein SORBI_3007G046800 [Sorghum bicolor]|nr:hypothetical protein SORBI_3007G046800 [Sorghum bicolor]